MKEGPTGRHQITRPKEKRLDEQMDVGVEHF